MTITYQITPGEAVALILDADADVVDLRDSSATSDKFFLGTDLIPPNIDRPYQHCIVTDTDPIRHLGGHTLFTTTSFDIDHFAADSATVMQLAQATRQALDGYRNTITDNGETIAVKYIHWTDETHVAAVAIPGTEKGAAHIRQAYEMMHTDGTR